MPTETKETPTAPEWPIVRMHDSGALTVSRVCVGQVCLELSSPAAASSPPAYAHAVCDGFHASFTARASGEIYETTLKDEGVGELCSGDMIIGSTAFARMLRDGTGTVLVARDQIVVAWKLQAMPTLGCTVQLVLDRVAATEGTVAVLEVRLRAQAGRIAELETQVTELKTSMARVVDMMLTLLTTGTVTVSQVVALREHNQVPRSIHASHTTIEFNKLPGFTDLDTLQQLLNRGLDPNMRNKSTTNVHLNGTAAPVYCGETPMHHYAALLGQLWYNTEHSVTIVETFVLLIACGADIGLVDAQGNLPLFWLDRTETDFNKTHAILTYAYVGEQLRKVTIAKQVFATVRSLLILK